MKTEVAPTAAENERTSGKSLDDQHKRTKGSRRKLQPLQKAAGDKENLVGAGRTITDMTPSKEVVVINVDKKTKPSKASGSKTITVEDLTSEAEPSKNYWEALAEKRRLALTEALKENEELHKKVKILEEENEQCKVLLNETKALVETLTEILNNPDGNEDSLCDAES